MNKKTKRANAEKIARGMVNERLDEVRDKALGEDIAQTVGNNLGENWCSWLHLLTGDDGKCSSAISVKYANQAQNADALNWRFVDAAKALVKNGDGPIRKKAKEELTTCLYAAFNIELLDIAYKADPSITRNLEAANWLRAKHGTGDPLVDPNNSTCNLAVGGQS